MQQVFSLDMTPIDFDISLEILFVWFCHLRGSDFQAQKVRICYFFYANIFNMRVKSGNRILGQFTQRNGIYVFVCLMIIIPTTSIFPEAGLLHFFRPRELPEIPFFQMQMHGLLQNHYGDVIMGTTSSRITSLTIVYSPVYSDADQRKHQSSASLAFVRGIHRGPVNSPHKWPVTRKMFPFDDVIMCRTRLGY